MVESGADLTRPHQPDFAFETATRSSAQAIATELDAQGHEVVIYEPDNENPNWKI